MPRKRDRYIGWVVLCSDPAQRGDRLVCRAESEGEARATAARLNRAALPDPDDLEAARRAPLYFAEWWSTSSSLSPALMADPVN